VASMIESVYQKKQNIVDFAHAYKNKLIEAIHFQLREELKRREIQVLVALISFWNYHTKSCFPSLERIGQKSHYSIDTISRAIKVLEEKEFIEIERSQINGRNKSNKYRLTDKVLNLVEKGKEVSTCQYAAKSKRNQISKIKTNINNKNNEKSCVDILCYTDHEALVEEIIYEKASIDEGNSEIEENKNTQIISDIYTKLNSQNIFIKLKYLLKFAAKHGIQQLQNSIQAANAYIQNQAKAGKSFNASKITQAALNIELPWKFDQEKHLDLDAAKEAEKQRLKLKPLFSTTTYLKCPQTGQKLTLDLNNFDRSCFKKLNTDSGEYEFFVFAQNTQTGEQIKLKINPDNPPLWQETDNKPHLQEAKQRFKYLFDERAVLICPKTGITVQLEPQYFNSPAKLQAIWNEDLDNYEFVFQTMANGKLIRVPLCNSYEQKLIA
jgi:DNA-binding MarR family transcriptional regulator